MLERRRALPAMPRLRARARARTSSSPPTATVVSPAAAAATTATAAVASSTSSSSLPPTTPRLCDSLPYDWCPVPPRDLRRLGRRLPPGPLPLVDLDDRHFPPPVPRPASVAGNSPSPLETLHLTVATPLADVPTAAASSDPPTAQHVPPSSAPPTFAPTPAPTPTPTPAPTPTPTTAPAPDAAVLFALSEMRATHEQQQHALERVLAAQTAQTARLEARLDALVVRETHRARPRPAAVLAGGLADAAAALLLALFAWLVARPAALVWRAIKRLRRQPPAPRDSVARRSWRLSTGKELLDGDPFLASAARRLSFSAVQFED